MTQYSHSLIPLMVASAAAWLMLRAGLAKNGLEYKRKPPKCPTCGRIGDCSCF